MDCLAMRISPARLAAGTGLCCAYALNGKGNAPHNRNALPSKHAVFFGENSSKGIALLYRNLNAGRLETCIHEQDVTRYPGSQVGSKEQGGVAHFFNGYVLFQGGVMFDMA